MGCPGRRARHGGGLRGGAGRTPPRLRRSRLGSADPRRGDPTVAAEDPLGLCDCRPARAAARHPRQGDRRRRLRAGHASAGARPCPRRPAAGLWREPRGRRRRGRAGHAGRRRDRAGRLLPGRRRRNRMGRRAGDAPPRRRGALVGRAAAPGGPTGQRDHQGPALARHGDPAAWRATDGRRAAPLHRRIHAALSGAWLGRSLLRSGASRRHRPDGVDPYAGCLPRPRRDRRDAAHGSGAGALHPRAGLRLLRAQRRRRRRGRRRPDRPGLSRASRAAAADARAGGRLGTLRPRHGDPRRGGARRRGAHRRLVLCGVEQHPQHAARRRRRAARRPAPGPALRAARAAADPPAGGRRRPQCAAHLHACPTPR